MILNDEQYESQKERFLKLLDYWWKALDMAGTGFILKTMMQREENKSEEHGTAWQTFMTIDTVWQYQTALMNAWLPEIADLSDDEIEGHLVHELMHIVVNEMRYDTEENRDHEERVVTSLSRRFLSLRSYCGGRSPLAEPQQDGGPVAAVAGEDLVLKEGDHLVRPVDVVNGPSCLLTPSLSESLVDSSPQELPLDHPAGHHLDGSASATRGIGRVGVIGTVGIVRTASDLVPDYATGPRSHSGERQVDIFTGPTALCVNRRDRRQQDQNSQG